MQVVDTDDFFDLFACGTEVEGSCQHVDGSANLNKSLLAYVLDGKNRLLALKDAQGKMQARAILRLLIDQITGQPVLFMERIYPTLAKAKWQAGLEALAKRKALALGLPLLCLETKGKRYPHPIASLGSPAPFEYVDALPGIAKQGQFTLLTAHEM